MSKQITKKARDYLLASTFLKDVKKNGVTYKKLQGVLFGEHATAFIAAIRKHGQPAFKDLKKSHQFMYMVEVAIEECIKKQLPMTQITDKVNAMPIPDGAEGVYFDGRASIGFYLNGELRFIHFPPGTWRFLFTTKSATEEDARKVVEEVEAGYKGYDVDNDNVLFWREATNSLNSLLRSKGLDDKNNYALIEKLK